MNRVLDLSIACTIGVVLWLASRPGTELPAPLRPLIEPDQPSLPLPTTRVLYVYTTAGCPPCATLKASLQAPEVKDKLKGWKVLEINSKKDASTANVSTFPTVIAKRITIGRPDVELGRFEGSKTPKQLGAWLDNFSIGRGYQASVGGKTSPDGKTELDCDLPGDQHCKNVSSRGEGCCVQTSINHSARWQNVVPLIDFHKWVQEKKLSGGAHPGLVDERIPKCCKDRGYPVPQYLQVEGSDLEILKTACRAGRMPGVTYSRSPTGRYGGARIAHMVSLVHADDQWFVVLDNNYIGETNYEWMTPAEFKKAYSPGWAVILLSPPPPPPPRQ